MDEKAGVGAEIAPETEAWLQSLCDPGRPVIATPGEMESILVRGDGWRGQIMPVKYDYARHQPEAFAEVHAIEDLVTVVAR